MPLVRSNDAPDSADPVRCASPPCFKPSSMLFFPAQPGFSSDESRPRSLPRRANGAPGPYPAADIASSPRVASVLAPSVADARRLSRITRRSGAIFGLVPSTGAPPHDAHPGSPGGGFGGSSYGGGGSYGGDTRETQQYTDYQCVHTPIFPCSRRFTRENARRPEFQPARPRASIDHARDREPTEPDPPLSRPNRNMGNGWVQRTRRSTVERVIERVHTDVDEMVPMRGGAGGHLHGGGGGGGGLVPHGGPGSNGWLNGELARQVHSKFEDMVRQSPAPTRAERSAYDELVRSFPPPESRGQLALGDGSAGARDPAEMVSPTGGYAAPWMNGGGGGGGDDGRARRDGRYPSRLGHLGRHAAGRRERLARRAKHLLRPQVPAAVDAKGVGRRGGSGSGFTLDDLILRKKGPDAAAARGAIFSPPPSPPGGRGRGRGRRGRKPGAGAVAKKPSPTPEPSESSSESEDADEDADADYVSPGGTSPLEKLARAAEKRGATRAGASPRGVGKSPRSPASAAARAARRPHRIGDSDSDDDGNKIAAVRAGRARPRTGVGGNKRGSREARQLLIAAQRMARVTGGAGGVSGAVATATTPAAATPSREPPVLRRRLAVGAAGGARRAQGAERVLAQRGHQA